MEQYFCEEGNVSVTLTIHDSREESTLYLHEGEMSVAQWDRLCKGINIILHTKVDKHRTYW